MKCITNLKVTEIKKRKNSDKKPYYLISFVVPRIDPTGINAPKMDKWIDVYYRGQLHQNMGKYLIGRSLMCTLTVFPAEKSNAKSKVTVPDIVIDKIHAI